MADIQYVLRYENTWWQDVCRIEHDLVKWQDLIGGVEDILERTPEIIPVRTAQGSRVMPAHRHVQLPFPMYVTYRVLRWAPNGLVSMRHVITEADARLGLFFDYDPAFEWKGKCPE
jgi:hypothetical protein